MISSDLCILFGELIWTLAIQELIVGIDVGNQLGVHKMMGVRTVTILGGDVRFKASIASAVIITHEVLTHPISTKVSV